MKPSYWRGFALGALVLFLAVPGLQAQQDTVRVVVEGSVFDIQQGSGIPQARIQFFAPDTDGFDEALTLGEVVTRAGGAFRSAPLPVGTYQIRVTALGYQEFVEEIELEPGSPLNLTIRMVPDAVSLDPILVTGVRSPRLDQWGFYDRRERGSGATFTRQEIEARNPSRISDMVRTIAGVRLIDPGQGQGPPTLLFRGTCRPDVVIDGVNLGSDLRLDEVVIPSDIEGMEIYRGMGGPMEYTMGCGSVVVWTADPTARLREAQHPDDFQMRSFGFAAIFIGISLLLGR